MGWPTRIGCVIGLITLGFNGAAMKSALIALIFACLTVPAVHAGPDRISIMLGTHHAGATIDYEEVNPGIFLTWSELLWNNRLDLTIGGFRNSYGDLSLAIATAYPLLRQQDWGIDLFGALAWYPDNGDRFAHAFDDIVPIAGLQVRYKSLFLQAIPSGGDSVDATFSFGLTFPLN